MLMLHRELKVEKILTTAAFVFIAIAMYVIAITPNTVGYDISIYDDYPAYFWFFLIATIACGVIILLHQAFAERISKWWLAGLAIILVANTIFLLLPKFRGYALYGRWDTLSHLGYIRDILTTGHVGGSNFYPMVHILGASLIQVTGLSLENIPYLFFILFSNIYILNIYLLAKIASNDPGHVLLTVAFASPLIYSLLHVVIHPGTISLFMIPCLLYFYQKREQFPYSQRRNTALLLLLGFSITLFHPVTTIFVIIIFLTFGLAHALYSHFLGHKTPETDQGRSLGKNFIGVSLIMSITFSIWYLSYAFILRSFKTVFDWLIYQIGTSPFQYLTETLIEGGLTPIQTFELFMNRYGAVFLLLLISGLACVSVLSKSLSGKHNVQAVKFIYAILFLVALFFGGMMLFGYFIEKNPFRVSRFALLMGTILSGLIIYDFINGGSKTDASKTKASGQRTGFIIVIAIIVIVMVALGLGSVYGSPRVWDVNHQVTRMEIAGTDWFGRLKNPYIVAVTNIPEQISRFEDYDFGVDSSPITKAKVDTERLPSHFGYDKFDHITEALDFQDRYLVIFGIDKKAAELFQFCPSPKVHQYTEEDFVKLGSDPTAIKIYSNGEFEVWRIFRR